MQTFAKLRDRGTPLTYLRGARLVDMDGWSYPRIGVQVFYMGRMETFYTTRDWQKVFDIDRSTVYKWQKMGIIPEPLFTKKNKYNKLTRFHIRGQLAAVAKVVNDLRRQGILRFRKDMIKHHLVMIERGNEIALDKWHKVRENRFRKKPKIRWKA